MIVSLSQILGHLFKNSVLKYIHNSKHVFSFLPSNPNIKDITHITQCMFNNYFLSRQCLKDKVTFSVLFRDSKSLYVQAGTNLLNCQV